MIVILFKDFIKQFITEGGVTSPKVFDECFELLDAIKDPKELVAKCIEGIDDTELPSTEKSKFYKTRDIGKMILDPLPNLYAPRDPFASMGRGVSLHRMYSVTRQRETIFGEYIFKYHPKYKNTRKYYDRYDGYSIEGGDIQVLSPEVIFIGVSQRTEPDAIANLARNVLKHEKFKHIIAIDIPDERSFMHLDTVMTRVDYDKFAVHNHVMAVSDVYELTLEGNEVKITFAGETQTCTRDGDTMTYTYNGKKETIKKRGSAKLEAKTGAEIEKFMGTGSF